MIVRACGIAYLVLVAYLVLWPTPGAPSALVTQMTRFFGLLGVPEGEHTRAAAEFVSNVLMTIPAPLLLSSYFPHWGWRRWVAGGLLASVCVELYQLLVVGGGRSATVRDVVANTLGVALGCGALYIMGRVRRGRHHPHMIPVEDGLDRCRGGG